MDETAFLQEANVEITTSRIVIDGKTFATRNIGSLALKRTGIGIAPILLGLLAVGLIPQGGGTSGLGLAVAVAAAVLVYQRVNERTLVIVAGGGETVALKTTDKARAERVHAAVARAIAAR